MADIDWSQYTPVNNGDTGEEDVDWSQFRPTESPKRSATEAVTDTALEGVNAFVGGLGAAASFVSPGSRMARNAEDFIRLSEADQSDVVKQAKSAFRQELESAETVGDEVAAVARYVKNNPGLVAAQAVGSFVGPGLAVKGAQVGARALGAGAKGAGRAGQVGGMATGAAMSGGDAAGDAYDLVMGISEQTLSKTPQWAELEAEGKTPAQIREELAQSAGRDASIIPALIGGVSGAFGAERLLAGVGKKATGRLAQTAKGALSEGAQEAVDEGVSAYEGRRAAAALDQSIDPTKGVAGAATLGGVLGAGTGGAVGGITPVDQSARRAQLERTMADSQSVEEISAAALELAELGPEIDNALRAYLPATPQAAAPAPETVAPAQQFEDLTPMTRLQATQRLAVIKDQNQISGREFAVVQHPSAEKAFAIERSDLPMTEVNPPVPERAGPPEPQALDRAAPPLARDIVAAGRTERFLRDATQKATLDLAEARLAPEDRVILDKATKGPFALSLEERNRLQELNGGVKMSPSRDIVRESLKDENADIVDPGLLPAAASIPVSQRGSVLTREVHGLVQRIGQTFGKEIVVFRGGKVDGFVRGDAPSTIYISETASKPHLVILGHEITHQMKQQLGNAYSAFEEVVKRGVTAETKAAFEADYGAGADIEELSSDLMGNRFQDPEFWGDVFKQIDANLGRKAAIGVVQRLGNLIGKAVTAAKKVVGNLAGFKADTFINNLDEVKAAAKKALAQYAVARREAMEQENGPDQQREQESVQQERGDRDEGRPAAEAGGSNRLRSEAEKRSTRREETRLTNNASGESEASAEAQSRLRDETARGRQRLLVDRDGTVRPLVTADRVDQRVYAGQVIVQRGVGRDEWTVLDAGPGANKARAIERAKSWSPAPVREEQAQKLDQLDTDFSLDEFVPSKFSPARIANLPVWSREDTGYGLRPNPPGSLAASAESAFENFVIVPKTRQVPIRDVRLQGTDMFRSDSEQERIRDLAAQIKKNKTVEPVYIGVHTDGEAYLMEGQHRARALLLLGETIMPARFVLDRTEGGTRKRLYSGDQVNSARFIDAAAAKADKNPSAAQIEADNYAKGHVVIDGMDISIETAKGAIRRSKKGVFPPWKVTMPAHYGDIKGTTGADGDAVDITIGPKGGNGRYWVIDQNTPKGAFDEHKVFTGVDSAAEAKDLYMRGFADNFGEKIFDAISPELDAENFKAALPLLERRVPFNTGAKASPKRKSEELPQISDKDRAALTRAAANLTPAERAKLRTDTAQRMVDLIRELPSANEIAAVAFAGRAKRGWYEESAKAIANVFGPDAPRFTGLLAAMSPQTSVENNLTNALNTWKNWIAAGRPAERQAIIQVMGRSVIGNKGVDSVLDAWVNNSVRALTTEGKVVLSGPKVNSFMENLIGNVEEVTNDAWMSNFALVNQTIFSGSLNKAGTDPGKTPGYLAMNAQVRAAARELTKRTGVRWTPAEVQETVWSWAKTLYEAQKDGITATDILYNEELTDDLIRATPDFRTLFHTPANERILGEAGLGDEVRRLRDEGPGASRAQLEEQEEPFDSATQARYEVNAAKRLERLKEEGEAAKMKASPRRELETRELKQVDDSQEFYDAIKRAKTDIGPVGASVELKSVDEYNAMRLFMTKDGTAGFALNGDDIVSVFSDGSRSHAVDAIMPLAIKEGGRRLDAFDTVLPKMYAAHGMRVVARLPFNDDYAPPGWDYKVFDKFNAGRPDVVFMVYDPENASATGGKKVAEYDEGLAAQQEALSDENVKASPRRDIVGASKRDYTPEQRKMFSNVGREVEVPTVKDRIVALRKDLGKRLAQGIADQFMPVKELTKKGYNLMRLSKGSAGAVEAFLHHGKLSLRDGAYDADQSGGFIERLGVPLHGELEDFLWWVAANRAERLTAEDRENLFTEADIAAGKSLATGTTDFDYVTQNGRTTRSRATIYADALKVFDEFNRNAMDVAEQSGLIDPEARKIWEHQFYVPFYRVSDDDRGFVGGNVKSGVVRQRAFKALKGGTDKLNSDLLANTLQNWAHLIDASAKNRAAEATLEAAVNAGIAVEADAETVRQMAKSAGARNSTVWFMDGGKERHFLVEDPYILTALNGLEFAGLRGPLMDALSSFKHWLTIGVTASPAFKIRNLIRDSMQAIAVSGLSYNPITNVVKGFKASDRSTQEYVSALASGGLIRFGTMLEGKASDQVRQLVRMGVDQSTILDSDEKIKHVTRQFEKAFMAYSEIGNRGEEINRSALFQELEHQGFSRTEAAVAARDLLDFSMQGSWTSVRFLTQVVPFMNARIQGLYKLGRAAKEDPKRFSIVLGAVALVSLSLMALYGDDDDWKKREDWDRDNYWWFKLGGLAYRIPKPFEIGALATLAERGVELFTDKEMTSERFLDRVKHIVGDNLAMNPVPQAVKPILDIYSNKDSFTGRPIESMGMEKKRPDYRFTARTSMPARAIGTAGQKAADVIGADFLSPVQVDHLIRGYLGWLGSFAVGGADMAIRPLTNEPTRATADYYKLATQGFVAEVPDRNSRYVTALYEQSKRLDQAYSTWRGLVKEGKVEEAREFLEENRQEIIQSRQFDKVKRAEARLNEQIRIIERSTLDPDEKKARISRINAQKDRIARSVTQPR